MVRNNGFLFESGSVNELTQRMLQLEKVSEEEYESMVQHSLELFDEQYTAENHFEMLKKVYNNAIQKKDKATKDME